MSTERILDILISAGIVQGFFMAWVLLSRRNANRRSNLILSILLCVLSFTIFHTLFIAGVVGFPHKFREPFLLLIGPLLSFYVRSLLRPWTWSYKELLHFVAFVAFFGWIASVMSVESGQPWVVFAFSNLRVISLSFWIFVVAQYGFYWWKIHRAIGQHKADLESEFSNTEGKTLTWLQKFVHVFGVFFLLLIAALGLTLHELDSGVIDRTLAMGLTLTVFVLGYEGLFQGAIFSTLPDGNTEEVPEIGSPPEPQALDELVRFMETKKPYLDESLSLTDLARQVGMTRNRLSELINKNTGLNFYSFVNRYRIEEFKKLMTDPQKSGYTLLALAFESGFSSKSSFQAIFKKYTGLTPTEYKSGLA